MSPPVDRFPPSFDDNPLTYAFALFSLSLVSAISLTIIIGWLLEAKRVCYIDKQIHNPIPRPLRRMPERGTIAAITLYRLIVGMLLATVVLGAAPDVLILLAWREGSPGLMEALFAIDRLLDGALLAPFLVAIFLVMRAAQVTEHRLTLDPVSVKLRPAWSVVREKLRLVALLLLIAAGVTVAKAYPETFGLRGTIANPAP